ncbi:MAG: SLC13 family permease [Desulfurococcaceae archaeon]
MFQSPEYVKAWLGFVILAYLILGLLLRSRRPWIPVWCVMAFSSFMTMVFGLVGFDEIGSVIDMDVILFLIGMFSLVGLAESSGLLNVIAIVFISLFKRATSLVYGSAILFGLLAAFAVNDTVALIGPPIAYTISRVIRVDPKMMFLLLAFSLTIGSVMTPIGNPQNVLIAVESGITAPFIKFISKLALPTIINLVLTAYILIRKYKVRNDRLDLGFIPHEVLKSKRDAVVAGLGISLTVATLIINDILQMYGEPHITYRGVIPFVIAASTYLLTSNPRKTISNVDWAVFFCLLVLFVCFAVVHGLFVLEVFECYEVC